MLKLLCDVQGKLFYTKTGLVSTRNISILDSVYSRRHNKPLTNNFIKGRFLLFQVCRNFANLFFKLLVSTFYKEISKFQQMYIVKRIRLAVLRGIP